MSQETVTIERASVEDTAALTDICVKAFHSDIEFGMDKKGGPPGYDSVEWNSRMISSNFEHYYKILDDDQIVGGFISGTRRKGYHVCERIYVDHESQRKGIGKRAFELVWERYPQAQVWTLGTPEWNIRTKDFYEKIGFVQIGFTYDVPDWRGRFYEKQMTSELPIHAIAELKDGMKRVVVEGTITKKSPSRQVTARTGDPLTVTDVELSDDTGAITMVLWNEQADLVQSDRIRIENGYVKSYLDNLQLSVGKFGLIISLI
ncbi:MAG: GNAT family N-acetyltransferase [Candidatus Thorarchaeota archaeon]|nr:GNAT family N-acetyltransferase [Candidatus Thorarchaeota archaeon]